MPVGIVVALVGVVFIALLGWRLIPKQMDAAVSGDLFEISEYISEVRVPEESKFVGFPLHDLLSEMPSKEDIAIVGLIRNDKRFLMPSMYRVLSAGDILMLQGGVKSLPSTLSKLGCLPLAERGLRIGKPRKVLLPVAVPAILWFWR